MNGPGTDGSPDADRGRTLTHDRSTDPGRADRGLALIRVAAIPVIFAGERLVDHPNLEKQPFDYFLGAAAIYALAALVLAWRSRRQPVPGIVYAILDLVFICALTYTSGGAFSQLRYAFFLLPIGAAFLLSPPLTAGASAVSIVGYLAIALAHPATKATQDLEFVLIQAVYMTWMSVAAILLSRVLTLRAREIAQLATDRGRLVAQALNTEDRERRRLAEALHDNAIQNLMVARQELEDGHLDGPGLSRARAGVDRTIKQLRAAVFDLHPHLLEQAGLGAALQGVADQQARHAGFRTQVRVSADATGFDDQLVFSVARELLVNAAKHSGATTVSLVVERLGDDLVLQVADDGSGMVPARQRAALLEGHIGLASSAERIEAAGGSFRVSSLPGGGTTVRATLPVRARTPSAG